MLTVQTAKRILCYGDSNTWGQHPADRTRYGVHERWTGLLQGALGDTADIIEEGLSGRTTDVDYAKKPGRNGKTYLIPCVQSQNPLHGVVLMLGTNDVKTEFNRSAATVADAIRGLVTTIRAYAQSAPDGTPPHILLVSPVPLNPQALQYQALGYERYFNEQSVQASQELAAAVRKVAAETQCAFFDAGTVAFTGRDGVHLDKSSHRALAAALTPVMGELV